EKFYFEPTDGKAHKGLLSPALSSKGGEGDRPRAKLLSRAVPHESAHKHVTGEAIYTDDQTAGKRMLEVWPVCSPHARARILRRDAKVACEIPGIKGVLMAEDVPGLNDVGTKHDEILLARDE